MNLSKHISIKWIVRYILITSIMIMWWLSSSSYATTIQDLTNQLITNHPRINNQISTPRTLVQTFCQTIWDIDTMTSANGYYDPHQSFFIAWLCNEFITPKNPNFGWTDKFLKVEKRSEWWLSCNPKTEMGSCDIGKQASVLYRRIMNELGNMKIVHLYGINTLDGEIREIANKRSSGYLNFEICAEPCLYPQSYALLKSSFEQARKLAQNNTYLDYQNISQSTPNSCDTTKPDFNMAWCGLMKEGNMIYFHNMVYNELMWYQLFATYYLHLLSTDTAASEFNKDVLNTLRRQWDSIQTFQNSIATSVQATSMMLQTMSSIQYTFPVHMSLLVYQESVDQFRRSFAKIYTPLHQLYYKLRNVQEKS